MITEAKLKYALRDMMRTMSLDEINNEIDLARKGDKE